MKVQVYRNRRRGNFSVRDAQTRRVIAHVPLILLEDPVFKVSEAGRRRVLLSRQRNVHAYVEGEWRDNYRTYRDAGEARWMAYRICKTHVTYNPYAYDGFHTVFEKRGVTRAKAALFNADTALAYFKVCDPVYADDPPSAPRA